MKKSIFTMALILLSTLTFGIVQDITPLNFNSANVRIDIDPIPIINKVDISLFKEDSMKTRPSLSNESIISTTLALPAADAEIVLNSLKISVYDQAGNFIVRREFNSAVKGQNTPTTAELSRVNLVNSFVFREMYGFTVNIEIIKADNEEISIIESIDFDVIGDGYRELPGAISEAFLPAYEILADNFRTSYLANLPFKQPAMLIIGHSGTEASLAPFTRWKREKGFEVTVVNKDDIAIDATKNQIKEFIRNFYEEAQNKPEYLILIGGVNGNYSLPTFQYAPQYDATDLPYTLIRGDDYFPEMIAGRISATSPYEVATILNKTIEHEKQPFMLHNGSWMKRALVVGGSLFAHPDVISSTLTSERIAMLFEEAGYEVIEVYWRVGDGAKGTQDIIDALNEGVQIVTALGWGDANGWHYPQFHKRHFENILNLEKLPYVTSFVGNTGDFANQVIDPSFSEYWMKMGTPSSQNGAVAMISPSDLNTTNEYDNFLALSYHTGIQKEGIRALGSAMLRAKTDLYRNYPGQQAPGGWVEMYFHTYNILSDPTQSLWVLVPDEMNISIPDRVAAASSHLHIDTPGLKGGYVTVTRDNENYEAFRIVGDNLFIPLSPEDTRDILLTVTAENHLPVQQRIEVVPALGIYVSAYNFNGSNINPGERITMNVTVKNSGDETITGVTALLHTYSDEYVNIVNSSYNFGVIEADGTVNGSFTFHIEPHTPRHTPLQFKITPSPGDNITKIQIITGGILLTIDEYEVVSHNGVLDPGETAQIRLSITNNGEVDAHNLRAFVVSGSNAVTVQQELLDFGIVPVGEESEAYLTVNAAADAYVGREVYFQLDFQDEAGLLSTGYFNITLGEVTNTAPTGPCSYGYFAFDNYDVNYEEAPVYEWVHINPENGGNIDIRWISNSEVFRLDLPFSFRYYGSDYNEIYVCSNGWVSFLPTSLVSFRNYSIPSQINPPGIIAPFWDALIGTPDFEDSLRIATLYDEPGSRFIISWLDAYNIANISPEGLEQFQLILNEPQDQQDGDLVFQYHSVWNQNRRNNYSTVGIQSPCNTMGLQYAFNNSYPSSATPLQPGLAIRFTTNPPDQYTLAENETQPQLTTNLRQNYPNPFNPETVIEFDLPRQVMVKLEVYNIIGQKVRTLVNEEIPAGNYRFVWDGKDDRSRELASGVYLYKLTTPMETKGRRMILLK